MSPPITRNGRSGKSTIPKRRAQSPAARPTSPKARCARRPTAFPTTCRTAPASRNGSKAIPKASRINNMTSMNGSATRKTPMRSSRTRAPMFARPLSRFTNHYVRGRTRVPPRGGLGCGKMRVSKRGARNLYGATVHLHDEGSPEGHAPGKGDPEGNLALLLPGRQDRRSRRERSRQKHAPPHHGGTRPRLRGGGFSRRGDEDRLPRPGARPRPEEERSPERGGGRRSSAGASEPLRGAEHEARRGALGRRDGPRARGAISHPGPDRGRLRLGPRPHPRDRHGRPPAPPGGCRGDPPLGGREAPRRSLPGALGAAGPPAP